MSTARRLWIALGLLPGTMFVVSLWVDRGIHRSAPPLPERVVSAGGQTLFTHAGLETGRKVWQSFGGQQLGSVWGPRKVAPRIGVDCARARRTKKGLIECSAASVRW